MNILPWEVIILLLCYLRVIQQYFNCFSGMVCFAPILQICEYIQAHIFKNNVMWHKRMWKVLLRPKETGCLNFILLPSINSCNVIGLTILITSNHRLICPTNHRLAWLLYVVSLVLEFSFVRVQIWKLYWRSLKLMLNVKLLIPISKTLV